MPTYLSPGVYVEEMESGSRPIEGVGTAVAAFVGLAQTGPVNETTLVSNWSQFTQTFGDFVEGSYLAHAVYGYFQNGGGNCYVVRVGATPSEASTAMGELPSGKDKKLAAFRVAALEEGDDGNRLSVEIADAGKGDGVPEDAFRLIVKKNNRQSEDFDQVTVTPGPSNVVTKVNEHSKLIRIEEAATGGALAVPPKGTVSLEGGGAPTGDDRVGPNDYVGDASARTGLGGLEAIDPITMVLCPDLMAAYEQDAINVDGVKAVQLAMIAHCEMMGDRVAILDTPPSLNAQQVREWRVSTTGYDSKYAAMYWPWIKVMDPSTGDMMHMPPSGQIAGIWGRNDDTRGVHKAPANEVVRGALEPQLQITSTEQELLNPEGINCIRAFPGRGVRVWGARTISSDPAWRYLNVRRLFNYLEESILGGTQWAVFEPNDAALWARIRRTITSFLVNEWRAGALFGATPDAAFYVKCDGETNTQESIDAGMVICEIGVAPVKPAEFVVFRLSQFSGGAALAE
jgi:phage tail sheath protein FI